MAILLFWAVVVGMVLGWLLCRAMTDFLMGGRR